MDASIMRDVEAESILPPWWARGYHPHVFTIVKLGRAGHERMVGCEVQVLVAPERECCLLVLNSVTSTPQWIRQPEAT